jgi:hypothetical protein
MTDVDTPARLAAEAALTERTRIARLGARWLADLERTARGPHFTRAADARAAAEVLAGFLAAVEEGEQHEPATAGEGE